MIIGIGNDLCSIERIQRSLDRFGERFEQRVFTPYEIAKARGAKRALMLPVSAPFHCALMQPAAEAMEAALAEVAIAAPRVRMNRVLEIGERPFGSGNTAMSRAARAVALQAAARLGLPGF